jgi:hypothetical protein
LSFYASINLIILRRFYLKKELENSKWAIVDLKKELENSKWAKVDLINEIHLEQLKLQKIEVIYLCHFK